MASHFDLFVQTSRIIIERYRSRYDVILYTFHLLSFLPSTLTAYIFALSPTNSVIIAPLFSSFIRPGTFLFARGIPYTLSGIIARVESSDIAFHILVNIIAFYMINETICVEVHDFAFIAIHQWHVLVVKFVQADFRYVEYAHTHVNRLVELYLEFVHFDGDQIFRKVIFDI